MTRDEAIVLIFQYGREAARARRQRMNWGEEEHLELLRHVSQMPFAFPLGGSERKAMRWLGFMQGVLVTLGEYTITEVKEHSKNRSIYET